jgi:hypothetical protein
MLSNQAQIDRRIGDIGEDVVIKCVATKCEKHEVMATDRMF